MAPEGSKERIRARATLLRSLSLALRSGMSVAEWRELMDEHMSRHVAAAGPDDIQAIVHFVLGNRRPK